MMLCLMWVAMIAFWGLLAWATCALVTGVTRRAANAGRDGGIPATRTASWTSGWPAARSTPPSARLSGCNGTGMMRRSGLRIRFTQS